MNLPELAKTIRFDNASKGFDPLEGGLSRYLLLTCSEICEAQNEIRDGRRVDEVYYSYGNKIIDNSIQEGNMITTDFPDKPEGFPVEIADAAIRIMDIQAKMGYKIELLQNVFPWIRKDPDITLDQELLAVVNTVSDCFRRITDAEVKLNMALSALFMIADECKFNMLEVIDLKLAYNRTRPPKHGRQF